MTRPRLGTIALWVAGMLVINCSGQRPKNAANRGDTRPQESVSENKKPANSDESDAAQLTTDSASYKHQMRYQRYLADHPECANYVDTCPVPAGITWQCKRRFMHGVNYAWHDFGTDFGGSSQWGGAGVAGTPAIANELADMKAHGTNVVRWWIFPDLRGDGIILDSNGTPRGLGGSFIADLHAALELAERNDLYLMLTIFSFDAFRPSSGAAGRVIPSLRPIVVDPAKRQALLENVIAPMAAAAEASPNKNRLIAWDLINEPEWAMSGKSLSGDPDFDPIAGIETVSHEQMQTFLAEVGSTLKVKSKALVSVGAAAVKWKHAWRNLDLDFHQFHIYDWVNQYWPYHKSPSDLGIGDKPVVMGEFPLNGLTGASVHEMLTSWLGNAYAGGLSWSVTDPTFKWHENKTSHLPFARAKACELSF